MQTSQWARQWGEGQAGHLRGPGAGLRFRQQRTKLHWKPYADLGSESPNAVTSHDVISQGPRLMRWHAGPPSREGAVVVFTAGSPCTQYGSSHGRKAVGRVPRAFPWRSWGLPSSRWDCTAGCSVPSGTGESRSDRKSREALSPHIHTARAHTCTRARTLAHTLCTT